MADLREQLAELAHNSQWTGWMLYLYGLSIENADGSVTIPAEHAARWRRQMNTPYRELSEREKDSDRAEADKVLQIVGGTVRYVFRGRGVPIPYPFDEDNQSSRE